MAARCDARGLGDVLGQATPPHPAGVSSPRGRRATPWGATGLAVSSQHATVSRTVARLDPPRGSGRPASQPRSTCAPGGKHTSRHPVPRCPTPRARERGRPARAPTHDSGLSDLDGALAAAVALREAWVAQPRGGSVAPQARADTPWAPAVWLTVATGQQQAKWGWRCRTGPPLWAAARSLNTPERRMALWPGMTVGVFGEGALESRLRTALTDHAATALTASNRGKRCHTYPMRWCLGLLCGNGIGSCALGTGPTCGKIPRRSPTTCAYCGATFWKI